MASREIGSVYIRVRPDADGFRRDAQRQIRQQGPIEAEGTVDFDDSQLRREKRDAERKMNRRPIRVDAEIDIETTLRGIERHMRDMEDVAQNARDTRAEIDRISETMRRMQNNIGTLELGVDEGSFKRLQDRIEAIETELEVSTHSAEETVERFRKTVEASGLGIAVEAEPDATSAARAHATLKAAMPAIPVRTRLDKASLLATRLGLRALGGQPQVIDFHARLSGLARIEAALLAASRTRVVRMRAELTGRSWQVIRGGLRSMAGLGDMDEIIHIFENVAQRLDVIGSKWATTGTILGSALDVVGHAFGGLMVTAADVLRVTGLLAAAPTAILAAWAGFHVHRSIWQSFGDALDGDEDALAKLPPNALRAVDAINALSEAVNRSIQDGFWETMADEITRFAETVAPVLERGMQRTATIYADGLSRMLDLAQSWAESGQLGAAFSNINRFFEGMADGVVHLTDAFVTVGMRASRLFPRLGHSIDQMFDGLNQWAQWASETGRIDRWIIQAVEVTRQLGRVIGATSGMLQGLTAAFRRTGIQGLPAFVAGMETARDLMQSPEWQFRMGNIFEGMAIGARETWEGVRALADAFYDAHHWARELSIITGKTARTGLERFAQIISNPIFQRGSLDLFKGFNDFLTTLRPGFEYIGNILGELGSLSGSILREMAPGVNTLLGMFSDGLVQLGPQLAEAVEPLTDFIDNLGHTMRWNVNNVIVPVLGGLLDAFNALPPVMQRFITLAAVMSRWLPAIGQGFRSMAIGAGLAGGGLRTMVTMFGSAGTRNIVAATTAVRGLGREFRTLGASMRTVAGSGITTAGWFGGGALIAAPFVNQFSTMSRQVSGEMAKMRSSVASASGAIGNILRGGALAGVNALAAGFRGASRAVGSLVTLMGGLPGLALIGIITAIGTVRRRAAEAEQQVDSLFNALKEGDKAQLRTTIWDGMQDQLVELSNLGGDAKQMLDDLENGGNPQAWADRTARLTEFITAFGKADFDKMLANGQLDPVGFKEIEADAAAFGMTIEQAAEAGAAFWNKFNTQVSASSVAIQAAQERQKAWIKNNDDSTQSIARTGTEARRMAAEMAEAGEAFHIGTDAAQSFSQAIATLGDGRQSADARISAMSHAVQLMAEDYSDSADIVVEAWSRAQQAQRTAAEAAESEGRILGTAADGIATDYESMSQRQILAIQGATELHESAMARSVDAYDKARAAGKTHAEAVEEATSAYSSIGGEIEAFIANAQMSAEEAAVFRGEMARLQDVSDIEAVLHLTNLSEQEIQAAYDGLVQIREAGVEIDQAKWMAFIAANPDQALLAVANTEMALLNFEAREYMTGLGAETHALYEALAQASGLADDWASGDYAAVLTAITEMGSAHEAYQLLKDWDEEWVEAHLGTGGDAIDKLREAIELGQEFEGEKTATLIENGGGSVKQVLSDIRDILAAFAEEHNIKVDLDSDDAIAGLQEVRDFNLPDPKLHVVPFGTVETKVELDGVKSKADALDRTFESRFTAYDGTSPLAQAAKEAVMGIPKDKSTSLNSGGNLLEDAATARSRVAEIPDRKESSFTFGGDLLVQVAAARLAIGLLPARLTTVLNATGNITPFAQRGFQMIARLRDKRVSLMAVGNVTPFAQTAIRTLAGVTSKTVTISAINRVSGVVGSILGSLRALPSVVTTTIRTVRQSVNQNADGGLYTGSGRNLVRQFANGGFAEDHTARIYSPTTNYRVFAEPETGGEAYIPLASSKRARSLSIWKETGRRLGVDMDELTAPRPSGGPQINLTVNHPQAEPTSRTIQRTLEFVGSGGDFD